MKKAVKVYYRGTVQGIFFRQFIKESADKLGIKGFARNLEDGRVEAWLQGESDKVDEMIEVCRTGHKHAMVKNVEVKEERLQDDFRDFKILHF
ncbi:MAG: acylphosphatase [Nanoarchaeota archaeon]|nr:acylphosphatase [Nanoarchaeota archaeon]MBU4086466.1 acylphosphatase [Nanoarchaeota archaeon]